MTSVQAMGHGALPEVLALMEGPPRPERRGPASTNFLAPDVRAWVADPEQGVNATVVSVEGADATRDVLAASHPPSWWSQPRSRVGGRVGPKSLGTATETLRRASSD
ncbi:MAG: hypothetical protein ACXVFQ_08165 [Solirubrobacteraceae bacterium]